MKRKAIEKIPWQAVGEKGKMFVVAKVHSISGEDVLVVDFALDKPVIRIAMTKKDFENYVPAESPAIGAPRWGRGMYEYFRDGFHIPYSKYHDWKTYAERDTANIIHEFVYGKNDRFHTDWNCDIEHLQRMITNEKQEVAEHRRKERINKKMATVPEPTNAFSKWAMSFVETHIMFMLPFRKKKTTKAKCSACTAESEYKVGEIRPKQKIKCGVCGTECTVNRLDYENRNPLSCHHIKKEVLLFQKIENEFCERHFYAQRWIEVGGEDEELVEIARVFYPAGKFGIEFAEKPAAGKREIYYNKYNPWEDKTFWDDKNLYGMSYIALQNGPVYPRTITQKMFKGTRYQYCAMNLIMKEKGFSPISYLEKYNEMPKRIEMMVKTGLLKMALQVSRYDFSGDGKPWEQLGITKKQMNRLREINGGRLELAWMRHEESVGRIIDDDTIKYFGKEGLRPNDISFISDRMSERKIMNYIERQRRLRKMNTENVLILWRDYLSMALRLKMDVRQELIFKPRDVKNAHDELVKLCGGVEVTKRAGEIIQNFPDVDEILQSIKEKYEYQGEKYSIVVPNRIEDIIYEGRKLGHCLDKSDIYFDRIQRRESFIVFLRKTEDMEKPYYTLEIEPGGTARQKRTTGDRQDKDFQEAVEFIRKWQHEVKRRLNKKDKDLAAKSEKLREMEFEELQKNQKKVWHGALAGKLLVDVLRDDLMIAQG